MPRFSHDLHTHTTYSDGSDAREMAVAAADAGLSGIGFTDHCIVYEDPFGRSETYDFGETYPERRRLLGSLREDFDIEVFDGVEMNYDPNHESETASFLEEANFDYAIGSVHYAQEFYVTPATALSDAPEETRREAVDAYVDWTERLIESELFDVVGHLDLPQRNPSLRGLFDEEDYRRLADALADADALPEINAGRIDAEYGTVHPDPAYFDVFADAGVSFVVGTDSHTPETLRTRVDMLDSVLEDAESRGVEVVGAEAVLDR